ncbi:hypothetical protein [Thermococcus sp.]
MSEYGFYTTEGVVLVKTENHETCKSLVSLIDKYSSWVTFVSGFKNGTVKTYVGARFDYVKYWSSRYSRGILLVDVPKIKSMPKAFIDAIENLRSEESLDFTTEIDTYLRKDSNTAELKDDLEEIKDVTREYLESIDKSGIISTKSIKLPKFNKVTYPTILYRWLFLRAISTVLAEYEDDIGGIRPLNNILKEDEILYPLIHYSKFHAKHLSALWFSNDAPL